MHQLEVAKNAHLGYVEKSQKDDPMLCAAYEGAAVFHCVMSSHSYNSLSSGIALHRRMVLSEAPVFYGVTCGAMKAAAIVQNVLAPACLEEV